MQKQPFHEVLSGRLGILAIAMRSGIRPEDSIELKVIFETLFRAKMKAAHARQITEDHADLIELLRSAGQMQLAEFAEEVFADLRGREDEKKQEEQPVRQQTRVDHDLPVHRGN